MLRPFFSLLKRHKRKEMVAFHFAAAHGAPQSDLALPYRDHFPVSTENPSLDVDLVARLECKGSKQVNVVPVHGIPSSSAHGFVVPPSRPIREGGRDMNTAFPSNKARTASDSAMPPIHDGMAGAGRFRDDSVAGVRDSRLGERFDFLEHLGGCLHDGHGERGPRPLPQAHAEVEDRLLFQKTDHGPVPDLLAQV